MIIVLKNIKYLKLVFLEYLVVVIMLLRLKKFKMIFCICISPIINPQFRLKYLINQIENNTYPEQNNNFKNIINTPASKKNITQLIIQL